MPVIRPAGRTEPLASVRDHLADLLVKELMGERTRGGPVIFELPSEQINKVHVIVCWEEWKNLPIEARKAVVRDAYARFARVLETSIPNIDVGQPKEPLAPVPASVNAITWEDLATSDPLPYRIMPTAEARDEDDEEFFRLLMIERGAIWTPFGPQLRLPNKEMAAQVHALLIAEAPEAQWSIVDATSRPIMDSPSG
jgi:hypothetical protein